MPLSLDRLLGPARAVRRRVLLHRRFLAALLAGTAVLLGLQAARPAPPAGVRVWTAARDLVAGEPIGAGDVRVTTFPSRVQPAHALRRPVGRVLAAPLRRGQPLTDVSVLGPSLLARYPGRSAVPVRLTDAAVAALLRPGDRVDLVALDPHGDGSARVLSSSARVIVVPPTGDPPVGGGTGLSGRLVLLAVSEDDAAAVSAAASAGFLSLTISG